MNTMATLKDKAIGDHPQRNREDAGKYFVQAVGMAFDVLDLGSQSSEPLSLDQITLTVWQSKSFVFRILRTLEHKGLVAPKPDDLYEATHILGSAIPNEVLGKLLQSAEPAMRDLGREFR
jgi:DNA-binding IclR family transcriptional regulator